jgi:hypothetical protein
MSGERVKRVDNPSLAGTAARAGHSLPVPGFSLFLGRRTEILSCDMRVRMAGFDRLRRAAISAGCFPDSTNCFNWSSSSDRHGCPDFGGLNISAPNLLLAILIPRSLGHGPAATERGTVLDRNKRRRDVATALSAGHIEGSNRETNRMGLRSE